PPSRGARADIAALRAGLGDVVSLAREDSLSEQALAASTHLCPCQAADAADGAWLRKVMLEQADPEVEGDRNRQVAARLMIDALDGDPQSDVERAFRLAHGFGPPLDGPDAMALRSWRAAILRNYPVTAWRNLWRWLSQELAGEAMTENQLADRLADEIGSSSVSQLLDDLPSRTTGDELLPAEEHVRNEPDDQVPQRSLRQLALGARRLDDLDAETRVAFLGGERDDLGPDWVAHQLEQHTDRADLARDLVHVMLRRARRVALSKMQLNAEGQPYVPTRLRDRDGLLTMVGEESAGEVSLRGWTLAQVLCGLGVLDRDESNVASVTDLGRELCDQLR
nr:hypothetical protein [Baekduia sp.]